MILSMLTLCGCMDVKDMTEEESDMVAEYSAGVLLRYSDTYQWRLVTKEEGDTDGQTASEPESTEAVSSSEPQTTENADAVSSTAENTSETDEETTVQNVKLNDIYRLDGVNIKLKRGYFCQKYKNIQVSAGSGEKLFIVSFELQNTSSKDKKVNLMKRDFEYPLTIDGESYQLGINILKGNDMKYLNTTIAPGKKTEAVLVYNVPKSAGKSGSDVKLTILETGSGKQSTQNIDID
jgi:hypothetical protein